MAKFKKGDKVRVTADGSPCSFKTGEIVEIIAGPDSDGDYTARHADGRERYIRPDRVELIKEEPEFKVGDRCKIVANGCQEDQHHFEIGELGKIIGIASKRCGERRYRVEGGDTWLVLASDIKLVEEKPEETSKLKLKFKVGDKCRVVTDESCGGHGFDRGDIVTVIEVDEDDEDETYRCEDDDDNQWWCGEDDLELVEDEKPEEKPEEKPDGGYSAVPGELVKIIDTHLHAFKMGEVVIVIKQREDTAYLCHNGVYDQIVFATDIAEIVVGDKIKVAE